ncbi:unnamed protein product [Auanema sp. JU1783]|nr:unnamed protein product [Auanema sp. JU1783]
MFQTAFLVLCLIASVVPLTSADDDGKDTTDVCLAKCQNSEFVVRCQDVCHRIEEIRRRLFPKMESNSNDLYS